ncbi:hypothetical protein PMAYCL1PPCAC_06705, partial [Pristionchus mayeri]
WLFRCLVVVPYLGMQCFWGESAFAKQRGVVGTRVGYAGGTTPAPTYRDIGDHTEVTEVTFDPLDHLLSIDPRLLLVPPRSPLSTTRSSTRVRFSSRMKKRRRSPKETYEEQKKKLGKLDTYVGETGTSSTRQKITIRSIGLRAQTRDSEGAQFD